jgi:predicted ArsR family transcriptional regulator
MEFRKIPIIGSMKGMTVSEMAKALNIPPATVKKRLLRAGRKPFSQEALYTKDDFEAIKDVPARGRPAKANPKAPTKKGKK